LEEGRTEDAWKVLIKAAQWNGIKDLRSHLFDLRWDHAASLEAEGGREGGREGRREGVREGGAEDEAARQAQPACPLLAHHHHRLSVSEGAPTEKPPSAFAAFFKTLPLLLVPGLRATTLWLWLIWFSFGLAYYGIIILCASLFTLEGGEDDALFDYPALLYAAASEVRRGQGGREGGLCSPLGRLGGASRGDRSPGGGGPDGDRNDWPPAINCPLASACLLRDFFHI
jgi:hypothetical protein